MRGPALRGLGFLSAWGAGAPAWPDDARAAAAGRAVVACARPPRDEARFRRATREGLLALDAVEAALEDGGASREAIAGDRTGLLYVTGAAYARSNRRFIDGAGGGSIHFAETAPAVVPAEVAIELGLSGPYAIFIGGPPATLRAVQHGAGLLEAGACDRALVLAVEIFDECADLYQRGRRPGAPPLVEAAACLWLEPGQGALRVVSGRGDAARAARGLAAVRRRLGETFCCEPLGALDLWRRQDPAGTLALAGRWRGETARLTWTNVMAAARGSAT